MVKSNIKKEFNCDREMLWKIITDNTNYAWRSDLLAKPYLKTQQKRYMKDLDKELNK